MYMNSRAQVVADRLISTFGVHCQKIIVAGSLRRGAERVKDVEIVALPKYYLDLFGEESDQDELSDAVRTEMAEGRLRWRHIESKSNGAHASKVTNQRRYMAVQDTKTGIPVDLFIVRPPANYFWQLMIRTGPAEYSKWLVNQPKMFGWTCENGAVWRPTVDSMGDLDGTLTPVEFTSEKHVCETLGIAYLKPRDRK